MVAATAAVVMTAGIGAVGTAGADQAAERVLTGEANLGPWSPANDITIQTNDTVRWTFVPGSFHNVQSTGTNWDPPLPDDDPMVDHPDVTYAFDTPGVYAFICEAHPGSMDGTITVQDAPVTPTPTQTATPTPTQTPTPTPTPPPPGGGGSTVTPAPSPTVDTIKPTVGSLNLTAARRAVRVRFRLSEPATVTIKVKRRGSKRVLKSARLQAPAGTRTVTVRSSKLKKGSYTVEIEARDAYGNRSSLAKKSLRLRR